MKSLYSIVLLTFIFVLFAFSSPATADEQNTPNISDILITTSQTHLLLFCTIKNSFTPGMIEGVQNGIPVTFTFLVELEEIVNNWPDTTLEDMAIHHTLTYDPVKERYKIILSEKEDSPVTTNSLDQAITVMSELNGIKLSPREELEPDAPYALHVKATLAEKTLPLKMHYIIPFISLWDFETDWRTIEFRY